jgi:hypothetical protein
MAELVAVGAKLAFTLPLLEALAVTFEDTL